jgi:hypothetical protein
VEEVVFETGYRFDTFDSEKVIQIGGLSFSAGTVDLLPGWMGRSWDAAGASC